MEHKLQPGWLLLKKSQALEGNHAWFCVWEAASKGCAGKKASDEVLLNTRLVSGAKIDDEHLYVARSSDVVMVIAEKKEEETK